MRIMKAIFNGMGAPLGEGTGLRLLLAVLLLGAPVILQAQTVMGSISGQVVQPPPPVGTGGVAAGAAVRVCDYDGSTGTPCNPLTTNVYIDPPGTIPALNPSTADQYGNYSLWVPQLAHGYIVQVTPVNGITYSYSVMAVGGTVTSVAMTAPPIFAVGGSPITSSGTLALTLVTQPGNLVWATPVGGGIPIFRSILPADHASQASNTVLGNCTGVPALPTACTLTANMIPTTLNGTTFSGSSGVSSGNWNMQTLTMPAFGGGISQTILGLQGTAGQKLVTASTPFVSGNLVAANATGDLQDTGVAYVPSPVRNLTTITQTGDTALHTIYTLSLYPPAMTATRQLRITLSVNINLAAANPVVNILYGGTRISPPFAVSPSLTNSQAYIVILGGNAGVTSSQSWESLENVLWGNTTFGNGLHTTSAIDSTLPQSITVTYQGGANSDSITFYRCIVEYI